MVEASKDCADWPTGASSSSSCSPPALLPTSLARSRSSSRSRIDVDLRTCNGATPRPSPTRPGHRYDQSTALRGLTIARVVQRDDGVGDTHRKNRVIRHARAHPRAAPARGPQRRRHTAMPWPNSTKWSSIICSWKPAPAARATNAACSNGRSRSSGCYSAGTARADDGRRTRKTPSCPASPANDPAARHKS